MIEYIATSVANLSTGGLSGVSDPTGVESNPDGTLVQVVGGSDTAIYQFTLSTAWDASTIASDTSADLSANITTPSSVVWDDTGALFTATDVTDATVEQWLQSDTTYDISDGSIFHMGSLDVSSEDSAPRGVEWNSDESRLFVLGQATNAVYQYDLSTNDDLSTASLNGSKDISTNTAIPTDITFLNSGSQMVISDDDVDQFHQYTLSTAYDATTATYDGESDSQSTFNDPLTGVQAVDGDRLLLSVGNSSSGNQLNTFGTGKKTAVPTTTATTTVPAATVGKFLTPPVSTVDTSTPIPATTIGEWVIDSDIVSRPVAEVATDQTLSLTFRATTATVKNTLRDLKSDQEKVDVLSSDDGGFVAVDRANGENSFSITPPSRRYPLREFGTVHVQRYEEDVVGPDLGEFDVELEFVRDADRTDTPSATETAAADEWLLTTPLGDLGTARVDADVLGTGDEGVRRFELTARLTFSQAHVFEAAYARLRGGRVRTIPDGPNLAVDALGGDVTLTVDAPDGQDAVPDGDYVVREWDSTRLTDRYQSVSVVIAEKA